MEHTVRAGVSRKVARRVVAYNNLNNSIPKEGSGTRRNGNVPLHVTNAIEIISAFGKEDEPGLFGHTLFDLFILQDTASWHCHFPLILRVFSPIVLGRIVAFSL